MIVANSIRENPQNVLNHLKVTGEFQKGLLTNQFFAGCNFSGMNLDGIDFTGSDLTSANFENASLVGAKFCHCILASVVFKNAQLSFSDFRSATQSDGLLTDANSLWRAILPNGKYYDGVYSLPGDAILAKQKGYDLSDPSQKNAFFTEKIANEK